MRILHTADWHLGRVFHGQSLLEDQAVLLDQFLAMVADLRPDVVLISGDIYDRSVPPADAVRLLDDTLTRIIADCHVPVIAIAGNHDGPDRLSFGARLMAGAGLRMESNPTLDPRPVVLDDADGAVEFFALPYIEPAMLRPLLEDGRPVADHQAVLAAQMRSVDARRDPARRLVVLAHAFVVGGAESESERPLAVGGSSRVDPAVFDGAHYVALGHLHRPQPVGRASIRYAGSLMKYSFSEADHRKSVSLVELGPDGTCRVETFALKPRHDLRIIEGTLTGLLAAARDDLAFDDYLLCRLTDTGALLDAMPRLRAAYPNALAIERTLFARADAGIRRVAEDHRGVDLLELFADFAQQMGTGPLDEASRVLVAEEIAAIGRRSRRAEQ